MDYTVRLIMRIDTENPDDAVRLFVDNLVVNGLTNWIFRVENTGDMKVVGYYNGLGVEVDIDALSLTLDDDGKIALNPEQAPIQTTPDLPEPTSPATPNPEPDSNDEDLIRLAVTLNAGDKPEEES